MNRISSYVLLTLLSALCLLSSCKKSDDTAEQRQNASDAAQVQSESEELVKEIDDALNGNSNTRARTAAGTVNCNVTIDSTNAATGTLILTFNGQNCAGTRTRTGTVTIQLNSPYNWSAAGSVATLTVTDFHITRLYDNKSITLNGTHTITNVNGGRIVDLSVGTGSVVHTVTSTNMSIQFDDGTTRNWSVARRRTITRESAGYVVTVEGIGSAGGYSQVAEWGTNRVGNTFYSRITTPVVWKTTCSSGPLSGVRVINGVVRDLTITFGVNQDGSQYSGSSCPYGYKIHWTGRRGKEYEAVLPY